MTAPKKNLAQGFFVGDIGPATNPESVGERRIDRCLAKMVKAKTFGWAKAWSALLVALCNERNGQRTAAELDALERARGLR